MQNRHLHIPLSSEKKLPDHISDTDQRIIDAQNFIKKNFAQHKLTLDLIAKEACMTPQAFCRSLKNVPALRISNISMNFVYNGPADY